MILIKEFI